MKSAEVREVTPFLCIILVNASNNPSDKVMAIAFVTRYSVLLHCSPSDHRYLVYVSQGNLQSCRPVIWTYQFTSGDYAEHIRSTELCHWIEILNFIVTEGWWYAHHSNRGFKSMKKLLIRVLFSLCVCTGAKIVQGSGSFRKNVSF